MTVETGCIYLHKAEGKCIHVSTVWPQSSGFVVLNRIHETKELLSPLWPGWIWDGINILEGPPPPTIHTGCYVLLWKVFFASFLRQIQNWDLLPESDYVFCFLEKDDQSLLSVTIVDYIFIQLFLLNTGDICLVKEQLNTLDLALFPMA